MWLMRKYINLTFYHDVIKDYLCSSDADAGVGDATYALIRKKGNQQIK